MHGFQNSKIEDPYDDMRYPMFFMYILMCLISLIVPLVDLFLYAAWVRWTTTFSEYEEDDDDVEEEKAERKKKPHRRKKKTNVPFPLNLIQHGTTWSRTEYIGLTEYLWKFTTIGWKGIFVALSWPFWLVPIVIGSLLSVFIMSLKYFIKISFGALTIEEDGYYSLSDEEEEIDISKKEKRRKKD